MNLNYITYQTFPAPTANSLQTISHVKHFARQGINISLIFPLREEGSSGDLAAIQSFYEFDEQLNIEGLSHKLPFGKIKTGAKFSYLFSHLVWSYSTVKRILKSKEGENFITRSDWVFYFLSRKGERVVFECHQVTKLRKYLVKKSMSNPTSSLICLTSYILKDLDLDLDDRRISILPSAYDEDYYQNHEKSNRDRIKLIFAGNLNRFGEERGLGILIDIFKRSEIKDRFEVDIIGGPDVLVKKLKDRITENNLVDSFRLHGYKNRSNTLKLIQDADIGLMVYDNSNINNRNFYHLMYYTSPLKYFEYLGAKLQIVANDFPSHRELPVQEVVSYFDSASIDSFVASINAAAEKVQKKYYPDVKDFSMHTRASKILNIYN